jgi:tripartite-type tricarboxylate transporter receptor subunit TctC
LPTVSEALPDFVSDTWFAIVAPPGTPALIATRLSDAIAETVKLPDVAKRLADMLTTPVGSSPAETSAFMKRDSERWRQVIATAGIKPD